jgi:hypothetical protein
MVSQYLRGLGLHHVWVDGKSKYRGFLVRFKKNSVYKCKRPFWTDSSFLKRNNSSFPSLSEAKEFIHSSVKNKNNAELWIIDVSDGNIVYNSAIHRKA